MVNVLNIENALNFLAEHERFRFNAHQVAYLSQHEDVNAVYNYLITREPYVVQREYEVMCPNFHSNGSFKSLEEVGKKWIECRICGIEFISDPENIHIVFSFNPTYLQEVLEDLKKKNQRPTVLI